VSGTPRDDGAAAAARLRAAASWPSGDLVVSHTTGGANLAFARNWWRHLQRASVSNFALLATDDDALAALEQELPGRAVRCPNAIVGAAAAKIAADGSRGRGARYRSAGWTRLMFAVPAMVRWVLQVGLNVLWMDTDVVALSDPLAAVRLQLASAGEASGARGGSELLLASVDGRVPDEDLHECRRAYSAEARWGGSAGGWKLCGGLFYLRRGDAAIDFLRDWERRLKAPRAGAKNQPHYNDALRAARLQLQLLPCDLFPNGFRYASDAWRSAQHRRPVAVHANWVKTPAAKLARFHSWGMWLGDDNRSAGRRAMDSASSSERVQSVS
jgi:hypothetical protein